MIVSHLIEAVLISVLGLLLRWENQKRDKLQSRMAVGLEGRDLDSTAFLDLTDRENLKYAFRHISPKPLCFGQNTRSQANVSSRFKFSIHLLTSRPGIGKVWMEIENLGGMREYTLSSSMKLPGF